jgi:uncharacterized membrane protein
MTQSPHHQSKEAPTDHLYLLCVVGGLEHDLSVLIGTWIRYCFRLPQFVVSLAFCIHAASFCQNRFSITSVVICCLVTILAVGTLIYALTIFGFGFRSCARLRRSDSILVLL